MPRHSNFLPSRHTSHYQDEGDKMFLHGILDNQGMTPMGQAVVAIDLPCDWAQILHVCAEKGLEDTALIVIVMWHREVPPMTQQYFMNHGHPNGTS